MITRSTSCLLLLLLLLPACISDKAELQSRPAAKRTCDTEVLFEEVINDLRQVDPMGIPLVISGASLRYVLPARVERVIKQGSAALPNLERLRKVGVAHGMVADACISIIKAKKVQRSIPRIDKQTGISFVTYTILEKN
jgi:hypothetical protein